LHSSFSNNSQGTTVTHTKRINRNLLKNYRTRIIFTACAGLRMFRANPFNIWIALSKAEMLTKRWLANLLSIS